MKTLITNMLQPLGFYPVHKNRRMSKGLKTMIEVTNVNNCTSTKQQFGFMRDKYGIYRQMRKHLNQQKIYVT